MSTQPAIVVREAGSGETVLVLHGGQGPTGVDPLVDHLAVTHRVLAPTHPGWDGTDRPAALDTVPKLAALYRQFLIDREIQHVTIVGTSFGGWVAAELVAQLGESSHVTVADNLVLVDSVGAAIDGFESLRPPRYSGTGGGSHRGPSPDAATALANYTADGLVDQTLLARLAAQAPRTLMIWGTEDTIAPLDYGQSFAAAVPTATLITVPGAGHVPYREHPDAVWAILDRFLKPKRPDVHTS